MRAWVEIDVTTLGLNVGSSYKVSRRKHAGTNKCLLQPVTSGGPVPIEDPGWPDGTVVRVVQFAASNSERSVLLEREDQPWRPTAGVKASVQRFFGKHETVQGESTMNGFVYEGVVVKTERIAAGPNSDRDKSEVVFTQTAFIAKDDATASAIVLANAAKAVTGLDVNDVEIKLRKY